ncbi:MAG: hypothetical protein WD651_09485 [Acidimicrobiia bacterium]
MSQRARIVLTVLAVIFAYVFGAMVQLRTWTNWFTGWVVVVPLVSGLGMWWLTGRSSTGSR